MKQIYTKTGDEGTTSLRDGVRVPKDDPRIEVNGQIDHLNSLLGLVRASLGEAPNMVFYVQKELMVVMSHIATPDGHDNPRTLHVSELTTQMEQAIDKLSQQPTPFVIPGDSLDAPARACRGVFHTHLLQPPLRLPFCTGKCKKVVVLMAD